jgi:type VII secretion integral membrane protein EccD
MPDSLCRVAVHNDGRTVDLALPSTACIAELLPSIVDIIRTDDVDTGGWELHRCGGGALDESMTLQENQIRDGDLLWLTACDPPAFRWTELDADHVVAKAATAAVGTPHLFVVGGLATAAVSAAALASPAGVDHWIPGTAVSAAAVAGSVAVCRIRHAPPFLLACNLIAVMFAAVSGAIAVPLGPLAAHLLLASAAALSVSVLLLRLTEGGATPLTACATISLMSAVASLVGVTADLPPQTVGTTLAVLALAGLSAAPRFSITLSGIGPNPNDDAFSRDLAEDRVEHAHSTLTGLVSGSSAAATLGVALVAYGHTISPNAPQAALAFCTVISVALVLRTRTQVDPNRRIALSLAGILCGVMSVGTAAVTLPHAAHWVALFGALVAAGALAPLLGVSVGPTTHRAAEIAEYLVLAAIVPLACWIAGIYHLVRDAALA